METKVCKKCGRELPIEEFYKAKTCKDGHMNICKECFNQQRKQQQKQYYQDNKETIIEQQKQYNQEHKEEIAEYQKQYNQEHKEEIAEYQKQYRQDNKEFFKQYYQDNKEFFKQYYQDNKDAIVEYQKQHYQDNKETIIEQQKQYFKQYYQTPMGRASCLISAYGRADKNANRGECTLTAQWMVDNIFSGQKCIFCGETDWTKLGCDRIDNSLPHTPDNVNPCCEKCNKKRGRKDFEEFLLMI